MVWEWAAVCLLLGAALCAHAAQAISDMEKAIVEAAAPLTACPDTTAYFVFTTYPVGQIVMTVCQSQFQFTPPIFYIAGAVPPPIEELVWDSFTASFTDVPFSPQAGVVPACPVTKLYANVPGLDTLEICIGSVADLGDFFMIKGYVRADGIFKYGFDSFDAVFYNGFEGSSP